jgi:hypothetical protein
MKKIIFLILALIFLSAPATMAAYHHAGEKDADKFLTAYPDTADTKLDHCALCHSGGVYENSKGKMVQLGSCQWCHYSYGYDGAGEIEDTINAYGADYKTAGRNAAAVSSIDIMDSDGDGYTNSEEIDAGTFPGNKNDHPGLTPAPSIVYTRSQLAAMDQHTQFMLMNASRSDDNYTEYTGVPMKDLLDKAGILPSATGITVYAPDGWSQYHPLEYEEDAEMYHVYGNMPDQTYQYPPATYSYNEEADLALNPADGWCAYDAPGCVGRSNGSSISVSGGLKAILAMSRDGGTPLETGILTDENKLDGEGPYRVVVPQKSVNPPDQRSSADNQDVVWPYTNDWDHNAGACSRSATIIRVEPLPEGTTDVDILEAGWAYVDDGKVLIYGAISAADDGSDDQNNDDDDNDDDDDDHHDDNDNCFIQSIIR